MNLVSNLSLPIIALTFFGSAVALVALQVISPAAALAAIDANTLLLLFAMMIISAYLRLAGFFSGVGQFITQHTRSPRRLLAWILIAAGILSALCLNDVVVVVFAPLVLDVTHTLRRNPLPYLIGLAAAANIGSTATITWQSAKYADWSSLTYLVPHIFGHAWPNCSSRSGGDMAPPRAALYRRVQATLVGQGYGAGGTTGLAPIG